MKVYTTKDIRALYTQKVAELIAQGYQINYETMAGHQGEVAKIDLTDGKEVLRVLLEKEPSYEVAYSYSWILRVGKSTDDLRWGTIWNKDLETHFEIKFAEIREGIYTSFEEGKRCAELRRERWDNRFIEAHELSEAYKPVLLRWLRRQPGMKTSKLADITEVYRSQDQGGRLRYQIKAKGKRFTLDRA